MSLLIITGMSGAGKSRAIDALEDTGFFCIDNVPPKFLLPLTNLTLDTSSAQNLALVVDARSKEMFNEFSGEIKRLKEAHVAFKLLFMDCDEQELLIRYKETRRKHPLMDEEIVSVKAAIEKEREILGEVKDNADYLIDTTHITSQQLKQQILDMIQNTPLSRMQIKLESFGYKYGIPTDADLVFDVRCLPNPFYIPELKAKTGLDDEVYDYVFSFPQATELAKKIQDILNYSVPLYIEEGKSQLVVALGCTGGHHRSISFVRYLQKNLQFEEVNVTTMHRDLKRGSK